MRPGGAISPDTQAVIAYREPACQDCVLTLVCPLFPNVATALRSIGLSCHVPPVTEQDSWRRGSPSSPDGGAVAFVDPAHVKGTGYPSGGAYPARGILLYSPSTKGQPSAQASLETCTLATRDNLCTTMADDFLGRSWGMTR